MCGPRLTIFWVLVGAVASDNVTTGGTKLKKIPGPFLIVTAEYSYTDFMGVYVGPYHSPDYERFAFTSTGKDSRYYEVQIANQLIVGEEIILPNERELEISILQLEFEEDHWIPPTAKIVSVKKEYEQALKDGTGGMEQGFALSASTNPIKAFVVSWDQTFCEDHYKVWRYLNWPDELPRGMFCVYQGVKGLKNVKIETITYERIEVGTPCDDAVGSPVLIKHFDSVFGIIVKTFCQYPPYVAFALSPAFLPDTIIPTTPPPPTTTLPPVTAPPLPRIPITSGPCASASKISWYFSTLLSITLSGTVAVY